ncbi:hypothetical protein [Brachybacterium sp. FME24]|uniref:hypothetical protein n=1 Tax=Brachybacterium sp. FME24 TaxID=2742605 RepID=UPI001865EBD6|nr:hypothetical protein [Brachybacterium sp. FME24]
MPSSATSHRLSRARLAGALLAISLLAAGCSGGDDSASDATPAASEGSDAGGASDGGPDRDSEATVDSSDASDAGGKTAVAVPRDPYPVTPPPDDFEAPEPCSGEGAYFAEVGGAATPDLPERAGETLTIHATGITGDDAQLTATLGDGEPRPLEDITLGDTATIDEWTISVTSVCQDTDQVEFDLIN